MTKRKFTPPEEFPAEYVELSSLAEGLTKRSRLLVMDVTETRIVGLSMGKFTLSTKTGTTSTTSPSASKRGAMFTLVGLALFIIPEVVQTANPPYPT
jgi:hypothetical protein